MPVLQPENEEDIPLMNGPEEEVEDDEQDTPGGPIVWEDVSQVDQPRQLAPIHREARQQERFARRLHGRSRRQLEVMTKLPDVARPFFKDNKERAKRRALPYTMKSLLTIKPETFQSGSPAPFMSSSPAAEICKVSAPTVEILEESTFEAEEDMRTPNATETLDSEVQEKDKEQEAAEEQEEAQVIDEASQLAEKDDRAKSEEAPNWQAQEGAFPQEQEVHQPEEATNSQVEERANTEEKEAHQSEEATSSQVGEGASRQLRVPADIFQQRQETGCESSDVGDRWQPAAYFLVPDACQVCCEAEDDEMEIQGRADEEQEEEDEEDVELDEDEDEDVVEDKRNLFSEEASVVSQDETAKARLVASNDCISKVQPGTMMFDFDDLEKTIESAKAEVLDEVVSHKTPGTERNSIQAERSRSLARSSPRVLAPWEETKDSRKWYHASVVDPFSRHIATTHRCVTWDDFGGNSSVLESDLRDIYGCPLSGQQADGSRPVVNIACLGDSITYGGYPVHLRDGLDDLVKNGQLPACHFQVRDFGWCATTASKANEEYYGKCPPFKEASHPRSRIDIAIVMLGTNDSKKYVWNEQRFETGYAALIKQVQGWSIQGQTFEVLLVAPPPMLSDGVFGMQKRVVNHMLPDILLRLASRLGVQFVDANVPMMRAIGNRSFFIEDGVHLTENGDRLLAGIIQNGVQNLLGNHPELFD